MTIKNLVFQGGGVKGIAYVGALAVLEATSKMNNVENVAGTSAGAIITCLVALGYKASDIKKALFNTNFKEFEDKQFFLKDLKKFGLYKGDFFQKWMKDKIQNNPLTKLSSELTFSELSNTPGTKSPYVFATDLATRKTTELSIRNTPSTILCEAIRASMSIPLFFDAFQFSNRIPNNHLYVDGGVMFNYPISFFDGPPFTTQQLEVNPNTIGLSLFDKKDSKKVENFGYGHDIKYVKSLFETLLDSQSESLLKHESDLKRTILIDDFGIPATDFNISDNDKERLIQSGGDSTCSFFGIDSITVKIDGKSYTFHS